MTEQKGGKRILSKEKKDRETGTKRRMLLASLFLCAGLLAALSLGAVAQQDRKLERGPAAATPTLTPVPTPTPEPTPTPLPSYDFAAPAPEAFEVEDDWFSDAVFLGDSRSDGLRLYSGIRGADFLSYKSLMVFQATGTGGIKAKAIPMNGIGEKKTVLEWLDERQYAKVYIMFGINELGYGDDQTFEDAFKLLVDEVRAREPGAVVYIQSLIPVEPEAAHKTNPAVWLNNEKVSDYNAILRRVCEEKRAVYVDVQSVMVGEDGVLPKEGTTDGIHFTKEWYRRWYAYLKAHTVDPLEYAAGQVLEVQKEQTV